MSAQSVDEIIDTLAEKVAKEAYDKTKAQVKTAALTRIQEILLQPMQATASIPIASAPITANPVIAPQPTPTPQSAQEKPKPAMPNDKLAEFLEKKAKQPPPKPKRFFDKTRIIIVASVITLALVALVIGGALGQTAGPTITVTPDNSNIIQVSGLGFNNTAAVQLSLVQNGSTMLNLSSNTITSETGNFSATYIIPTSLHGAYTLTATTGGNVTAHKEIVVPDLRGTDGLKGSDGLGFNATGNIILNNGTQGAEGPKGDQGIMGNSTAGIVAVGLSIAALVIVIIPRKQNQSAP